MILQGGIDPCENPFVAAARELLEETGIRSIEFVAQVRQGLNLNHVRHADTNSSCRTQLCSTLLCMQIDQWIDYEFPTTVQSALTGCWTMYKGQTQKW